MPTVHSLNELLHPEFAGPYLSFYQPTHPQHPDNKQDPIVYRNLLKQAEESLAAQHSNEVVAKLMAPLQELASDFNFWNHTAHGLAIFRADGYFRVMHLQRHTHPIAVVADSFHVKPLLRIVQSADRFHVLCLTRNHVRLFEGNRDGLAEVQLHQDVPRDVGAVIGDDLPEPVSRIRSVPGLGAGAGAEVRHGHGGKDDLVDQQTERFFRAVDREFTRHHSQQAQHPLVLAGLPENQAVFRAISQNSHLLEQGIDANPDALSNVELRTQAWRVVEPLYLQRLAGFVDRFHAARADQQASADLSDVAVAAVGGRVNVLLVDADQQIPGRLDPETGAIERAQRELGVGDDLLDDLAEQVLRSGGEVVMVPAERMPVDSGLAAIYRF